MISSNAMKPSGTRQRKDVNSYSFGDNRARNQTVAMGVMTISRLFIYPIKSLLPVELDSVTVTDSGLRHDRSFVLIKDGAPNEDGISDHLTIETTSQLCLFRQSLNDKSTILSVSFIGDTENADNIDIPLMPAAQELKSARTFTVNIHGTEGSGYDMGSEVASFFSKHLKQPARLIYIGAYGKRDIPIDDIIPIKISLLPWLFSDEKHGQRIKFQELAPLLLTTTTSEEEIRARLPLEDRQEDVITRFRSNVHVDTSTDHSFRAYHEENWKRVGIKSSDNGKELKIDVTSKMAHGMGLNVDFATGGTLPPERQLHELLADDRRVNPMFPAKPCFGVCAWAAPAGFTIRVGDQVNVVDQQQ